MEDAENQKELEKLREIRVGVRKELNNQFTQATGSMSKASQTWALTIVVPAMAWIFLDGEKCLRNWPIIIVGLSLLSLLVDGVQYMYTAARVKQTIERINDDVEHVKDVPFETRVTLKKSYLMVVAKFCILVLNTMLLLLFLFLQTNSL